MRGNRKSGVLSKVEAINTNPLLSQASGPDRETTSLTTGFPATLFKNMDTRITYSRNRDGVRKLIVEKQMREAKYWP
jgi:hypothetical protein